MNNLVELKEPFRSSEIGELPASWQVVLLGEAFEVQQGKALSPFAKRGFSPCPFLRTANVLWGRLDLSTVDEMDFTGEEAERLSLKPGDLLVCEGGEIGRTALWNGEILGCLYQNHIHRLRTNKSGVWPHFVMYWMQAAFLQLRLYGGVGNRTTIPNLSGARLKRLPIPLPPFLEQRAIAGVLAKIQAAVEVQEKIVTALRGLKAATMAKLFCEGLRGEPLKQTEIGEIPESWEVVPLRELAERITKGSSPNWQGFNYCDEGVLFIRSQNVGLGELLLSETVYLPEEFNRKERRSMLSAGDVLINIVGASIGRAAVADERLNGANINQAVALVRLRPSAANPAFLMHFLITRAGLEQMHRQKKEIARANLSLEDISSFLVPVPALDEQDRIAESLDRIGRMVAVAVQKRRVLKATFSSMLHLLMTGQVRVTRKMIALQALEERRKRRPKWSGKVDEKILKEVVRRIVEAVAPEKIILFGSAARGEMGPDSDLDLLIVKECENRRETARIIRRKLIGIGIPIDVIVAIPGDIARHKDTIGLIYRPALREGNVVYAA